MISSAGEKESVVITRARRASRLPIAIAAFVLAAIFVGPIGGGVSAGAPSSGTHPGEVVCQTLTDNGPGGVFGECSNRRATGGSATFNFNKFVKGFLDQLHPDVTFNWASGRTTVVEVGGEETGIGACPPGGPGHDSYMVGGRIRKDTTGKVPAVMTMELCGPSGCWVLESPAVF
jgi:hypothetical protein